jgi:hypothetical protein
MGLLFDNERISEMDWLNRALHENVFSPAVLNNFGCGRADNNWWIAKDLGGGIFFVSPLYKSNAFPVHATARFEVL